MAFRCDISGKSRQFGNRVSHANNKTSHSFFPNLQKKRVYVASLKKFIRVRVSTRMLRTIDKIGIEEALRSNGLTLTDVSL